MRRRALWAIPLLLAAVGLAWWKLHAPSPESEVSRYLSNEGLADTVRVDSCNFSKDDSNTSTYICKLQATRQVDFSQADPLPAGESFYCFSLPRAASVFFRDDADPLPNGPGTPEGNSGYCN